MRISDLTVLDDFDPLKAEALRRFYYVRAVFDERLRARKQETLSPTSWSTLKRWTS